MFPDGISYLDMGTNFLSGDWWAIVNAHWSPVYPLLLGVAMHLFNPDPVDTFTVVHLVNYVCYLYALTSFAFLLNSVIRFTGHTNRHAAAASDLVGLSPSQVTVLGYLLFLHCSLSLITIQTESPDMLVSGTLYLVSGLILRLGLDPSGYGRFVLLGILLAIGYLIKSPLFVLVPVFLLIACCLVGISRPALTRLGLAILSFAVVATPWITLLSLRVGHVTIGESATLNYAWRVNACFAELYGQATSSAFGELKHPARKVWSDPDAFEFGTPVRGTYPLWYDPYYWHDGYVPRFDPSGHLRCLEESYYKYKAIFSQFLGGSVLTSLGVLWLLALTMGLKPSMSAILGCWPLWAPALIGLGLFSLVSVEPRYIAGYMLLLLVPCFLGLRLPATFETNRVLWCFILILAAFFVESMGPVGAAKQLWAMVQAWGSKDHAARGYHQRVAECLIREHCWTPGKRVAFVAYLPDDKTHKHGSAQYWARLVGARIVAEVPSDQAVHFWSANADVRQHLIQALYGAGADEIVARPPRWADTTGWTRISDSDNFVYEAAPRQTAARSR